MDLTVIRPLMFVDEMDVIGFKNKYNLPVVKSKCPVDGYTKASVCKRASPSAEQRPPGSQRTHVPCHTGWKYFRMAAALSEKKRQE